MSGAQMSRSACYSPCSNAAQKGANDFELARARYPALGAHAL